MGCFEFDEKYIYCHERPEDNGNWWQCEITPEEYKKLKNNEVSCYDLMNDGRKVE